MSNKIVKYRVTPIVDQGVRERAEKLMSMYGTEDMEGESDVVSVEHALAENKRITQRNKEITNLKKTI